MILVDWNALAISSLAKAYQITSQSFYLKVAQAAVQFIESNMTRNEELYHLWRQRLGETPGFLDDYANYILALLDLYECDFNVNWLKRAKNLSETMVQLFWDPQFGAFFSTSSQHNPPLIRTKTFNDDAIPSPNAQAAMALMRLSCYFGKQEYYQMAEKILYAHAIILPKAPQWYGTMLCVIDNHFSSFQQISLRGNINDPKIQELLQVIYRLYLPHKVLAICDEQITQELPICQGNPSDTNQAYICYQGKCFPPTSDASQLYSLLKERP